MIATSARTSVRLSPWRSAKRCPTASSSTVSRRRSSASSRRCSSMSPPPSAPGYSLDDRDNRPSREIMPRLSSVPRWLLPAIIALIWFGLAGPLGSLGGGLSGVQENDSAAFLPDSAESTRVTELQRGFQTSRAMPVILLWEGDGPLDEQQLAQITDRIGQGVTIADDAGALSGRASPAIPSEDGAAVQAVLPISPGLTDQLPALVADLRGIPAVDGTTAYVTGPGASFSDFADGFSGIDGLLLLAAFGVVLLILLVV